MIIEYYIDATFLVDFFLPDEISSRNEFRWKENAGKLFEEVKNNPNARLMISYESMLEAVGGIGRRLLEAASGKGEINTSFLAARMAHIAIFNKRLSPRSIEAFNDGIRQLRESGQFSQWVKEALEE